MAPATVSNPSVQALFGELHKIDEDSALVDVGSNVKIRFLKTAISDVNPNKSK